MTYNRRMLNPPKKDTPHPKIKEKPQQDNWRGAIMIKSNPIPTGSAAHKLENDNTKEVFPLFQKFWDPTSGFPAWVSGKGTGNPQGIRLWRPVGFDCRTSTGLGETDSTLGGHKQNLVHTGPRERSSASQETEPGLPASVGGSPVGHGLAVAGCGDTASGPLASAVLEGAPWCEPSWGSPLALP